ncbi:sister chromatid cohesion protein SCC2 [Trifolium repens]|nr:sister chromatid cohesion protein SCC2 [Trifolium repens]
MFEYLLDAESKMETKLVVIMYLVTRQSWGRGPVIQNSATSMSKISGEGETAVEHLIQVLINHMHFQLSAYGNCLFASSENELDVKRSPGLLMKYLAVEDCALQVRSLQALGYVLISRHEYMLENDIGKILEGTLSDVANDRLKWYFIQFYTC